LPSIPDTITMSGSASRSSALRSRSRDLRWLGYDRTSRLWLVYLTMGILLLAYLGWLISGNSSKLINGWGVSAFELVGGALCIAGGLVRRTARWVPIILGAALMAWATGHLTETIETMGGAQPPEVALYDAFQLSFYPLAYVAMVMYLRGEVRRLATLNWLDGVVAGLGAAALCAAFAFHTVASLTGKTALATAINLANSRNEVIQRMVEEAQAKGGNAIVGMRFDTSEMGGTWTEICAYGTAVIANRVGAAATAPTPPPV